MNVVSVPLDVTKKGQFQYEVIEDAYDETTQTRTVTEQAFVVDGKGRLIRTTRYTLNAISMDVVFVP